MFLFSLWSSFRCKFRAKTSFLSQRFASAPLNCFPHSQLWLVAFSSEHKNKAAKFQIIKWQKISLIYYQLTPRNWPQTFIYAMHYSIQFYFRFKAIPLPILLALLHLYTFTQYGEIFFSVCTFFPPIFPIAFHLQIHFYLGILILFCILVFSFFATITHEINSRKLQTWKRAKEEIKYYSIMLVFLIKFPS